MNDLEIGDEIVHTVFSSSFISSIDSENRQEAEKLLPCHLNSQTGSYFPKRRPSKISAEKVNSEGYKTSARVSDGGNVVRPPVRPLPSVGLFKRHFKDLLDRRFCL